MVRRPEAATPRAVETTPSMPLAPRFAITAGGVGKHRAEPFEIAHRHGGRHHKVAPPRRRDGPRCGPRGFTQLSGQLRRWRLGPPTRRTATSTATPDRPVTSRSTRAASAASIQRSPPTWWNSLTTTVGSVHCHHGSTADDPRTLRRHFRDVLAEYLGEPRGAEQDDGVGKRGWVRTMASAAAIVPGTLQPDRGSARIGHPSRRPRRSSWAGSLVASAPAMISPARPGARRATAARRGGTGERGPAAGGNGPASPTSGSRKARFRWTGPGPRGPVPCLGKGPCGERPPRFGLRLLRHSGITCPPGRCGEEPHLVDGLRRPDMMQLGRTVGRADDERHPTLVGLDDRRVKLGGGGSARHADDGRPAGGHGETEGEEPGAALVEADMDPQPAGQGKGHRRRARAGADHRIGDTARGPIRPPGWRQRWPVRSPGVALHVEQRGGSGPPLVLLHGFTQTGRLWGTFGDTLAQDHTLVAVDLPGHAGSDDGARRSADDGRLGARCRRPAIGTEPVRSARLLPRGPGGPSRGDRHRSGRRSPRPDRRHRRYRGSGGPAEAAGSRRGHRGGTRGFGGCRGVHRAVGQQPDVRPAGRCGPDRRAPAQQRGRSGVEPAVGRHGHAGAVVGSHPRPWRRRCSRWPEPTTPDSPPTPSLGPCGAPAAWLR